jgi:hypothetical protein
MSEYIDFVGQRPRIPPAAVDVFNIKRQILHEVGNLIEKSDQRKPAGLAKADATSRRPSSENGACELVNPTSDCRHIQQITD